MEEEMKKLFELLEAIKKGDTILFDNKYGAFKVTKIEESTDSVGGTK